MNIELASVEELFLELAKRARAQKGILVGICSVPMEGRPFDMATTVAQVYGPLPRCLTMSSYLSRAIMIKAQAAGMSLSEMAAHSLAANDMDMPPFRDDSKESD